MSNKIQLTNLKYGSREVPNTDLPPDFLLEPKTNAELTVDLIEKKISEDLGSTFAPQQPVDLPNGVIKFMNTIENNFSRTSTALRHRADQLRLVADSLVEKANSLDQAQPHLRKEIEDWISFERECAVQETSLSLVNPK